VFIEAKDDGSGGDNWTTGAISCTKLQSNHHHQQTNIQFLQAPSCHPTNSVKALKGKYHIPWTCLPQAHLGGLPTLSPGYLGEGCHASHQPSDASTPKISYRQWQRQMISFTLLQPDSRTRLCACNSETVQSYDMHTVQKDWNL